MQAAHRHRILAQPHFLDEKLDDNTLCDKVVEFSKGGKYDVELFFDDKECLPEMQVEHSVEMIKKIGYNVSFLYKPNVVVYYFNGKHKA